MKTFPAALRLNTPVATLAGADDSLAAINTTDLPNGALCFVNENESLYELRKGSSATVDSPNIIAPTQGGEGRWFLYGAGASSFQNLAVSHAAIPPQSSVDSAVTMTGVTDSNDIVVANLTDSALPAGVAVGPIRITGANAATFRFTNATAVTVVAATVTFRAAVLSSN
jgi:hypothetical protein